MSDDRPNILFIMTDQQRSDALSCRGNSPARTPNLDRLAAEGTRFDSCFVQCPLCVPSRWSMLTGTYVHAHGTWINEHPFDRTLPTWPERLAQAGYRTLAVGKTHAAHRGFARVPPPEDDRPRCRWPHGRTVEKFEGPKEEYYEFRIVAQAAQTLRELARRDEPWALHVGIQAPHPPYILPEPFDTMYDPDTIPVPEFQESELAEKTSGQRMMYERFFKPLPAEHIRRMIAGYWASVAMADECAGIVLDELGRLGLADSTLVCFVSDHGDLNGEHGLFSKFTSAYDSEVGVPMIWRWPGRIPAGATVEELVESIDLVPTIMEAAGLETFPESQGRTLWPLLGGQARAEPHRKFVTATTGWMPMAIRPQGHMIRTGTHKLVYYPLEPFGELYDLERDPREVRNLYRDPDAQGVRVELEIELLRFLTTSTYRPHAGHPLFTRKSM